MLIRAERVLEPIAETAARVPSPPQEWTRWLAVMRGEFLEMPGMTLTPEQAARLWGLEQMVCTVLLDELTATGFLRRTGAGCYCLNTGGC